MSTLRSTENHNDIGANRAAQSPTLDLNNDRLLTSAEIADVLRVHPGSVRRWTMQGTIPSLHIGRAVRYRLSDVLSAMESTERER